MIDSAQTGPSTIWNCPPAGIVPTFSLLGSSDGRAGLLFTMLSWSGRTRPCIPTLRREGLLKPSHFIVDATKATVGKAVEEIGAAVGGDRTLVVAAATSVGGIVVGGIVVGGKVAGTTVDVALGFSVGLTRFVAVSVAAAFCVVWKAKATCV